MKRESLHDTMKRDILNVYLASLLRMRRDNSSVRVLEVIDEASRSAAPRFYVCPRHAREIATRIIDGKPFPTPLSPLKVEMYNEIARRYVAIREDGNDTRQPIFIFNEIVEQPAPSFYIAFSTFRNILYEAMNDPHIRRQLHRQLCTMHSEL